MSWNNTVLSTPTNPPWNPNLLKTSSTGIKVENGKGYFIVPAFNLIPRIPRDFYTLSAQFNFSSDRAFSLQEWIYPQISANWYLTIGYRRGNWKTRFKLWDVEDSIFELYNAQVIHRYFIIEVWTKVNNLSVPIVNPAPITMTTSLRKLPDNRNTLILPYNRPDYLLSSPQTLLEDQYLLKCSTSGVLIGSELNINPDFTYTDNTQTINELLASSGQTASNMLPASYL